LIHYLDASALAKRYLEEPGSRVVRTVLRRGRAAASRISQAELYAAAARAARQGVIDDGDRDRILARVEADFRDLEVVEIRTPVVRLVPELCRRHPLRAYDAVQLACALVLARRGAAVRFWCADDALGAAARAEGLPSSLPTG
jgi:predicted nucleic acid-binding protein